MTLDPSVLRRSVVMLLLAIGAVVSILPFYWMAVAATHSNDELFHSPPPFVPGGHFLRQHQGPGVLDRVQPSDAEQPRHRRSEPWRSSPS